MKLNTTIRANGDPSLLDHIKRVSYQVNLLSEGRVSAKYAAAIAVPTTGGYAQGDFVTNRQPTGTTPVLGWVCTAGGTPGTFVPVTVGGGSATVGYARTFLLMGA